MTHTSVSHRNGRSQRHGESRRTGQWKLAYADFLTALMAFFLLMWLTTGSSQAERSAIASYFSGAQVTQTNTPENAIAELSTLISNEITTHPVLAELSSHIRLDQTASHLRIDLTDAEAQSLFATGDAHFSETGEQLIREISPLIANLPLKISIEGHTDAFKTAAGTKTNWEISSDRANSALMLFEANGVPSDRFQSVTGLAATHPFLPTQPHAAINRRISILLEFSD